MKKWFLITLISFISVTSKAQIYEAVIGNDLKEDAEDIVAQMIKGMNLLLDNAVAGADYVTEARLKEIGVMLEGTKNFIHNERISTLDKLDQQRLALLKGVDQMMARMPTMEDLSDLAAILTANIQDLANSFGGIISKDRFVLTRINGVSLDYKSTGQYRMGFIGNIFNKADVKNTILVNGKEMELRAGSDLNQMYITFPASEINSYFKDTTVFRIPIRIISVKAKKILGITDRDTLLNFSNTILLLPKLPFQYQLTEIAKNITWSEPYIGEKYIKRTVPNQQVIISASVPTGNKIDIEKTNFYQPRTIPPCPYRPIRIPPIRFPNFLLGPNFSSDTAEACQNWRKAKRKEEGFWVDKPVVYNEGKSVRRTFFTTSKREIWVEIYYRKPLTSQPKEIRRKFQGEKSGYLTYGVYESEYFSEEYASFTLKVKPFYGDWIIINPTTASTNKAIETAMELGAVNRLTVKIKPL